MNTKNNPFVLPGLGQAGELASNPMLASLEMMQQAWTGLAGPGGLTQTIPMSLEDLDRRIAELRTVENWLKLNQSMLASTIQGMEVQRATIATLKTFVSSAPSGDTPSPLEVVLGLKPAPAAAASAGSAQQAKTASDAATMTQTDSGAAAIAAAQSATQAWWDLMQQQFGQLASAAVHSMAEAPTASTPTSKAAKAEAASAPSTTRKAPAKRSASRPGSTPAKAAKSANTAKTPRTGKSTPKSV